MLDPQLIRDNPDAVRRAAQTKGIPADVDEVLSLDRSRRDRIRRVEALRAERNRVSKAISGTGPKERPLAVAKAAELKAELEGQELELRQVEERLHALLLRLPAPPAPDTPVGTSDADNVEIRRWGQPPAFDFPVRDHLDIATALGLVETESAVRMAGSRSYCLRGAGALLEQAVLRFAVDKLMDAGFTLFHVPVLVREEAMLATGYFPLGSEEVFRLERDDLYLIGTSEVPLVARFLGNILDHTDLPVRICAVSPCFRREVGGSGRDTRGLYRVHQFTKVEQVVIGPADAAASARLHDELLANAEAILRALELPYRTVLACTGDMGQGQYRKHDLEAWMPSRNAYGETHSCSTFHDFQARRGAIRYRDAGGETHYAHTLNCTAIASPRVLIPLLEVHQQRDGRVRVPEALVAHMRGVRMLEAQ